MGPPVDLSRLPITEDPGGAASGKDLLRAFTAISRALNLGQPLPETLDLIAEKVSQTMGHKYCAVLLADEERGKLLIEGSFGLSAEYVRALNTELVQRTGGEGPAARSVTAQAYRTGMPVYAPDITADQRFVAWRAAALEVGYKSIVALPLVFRGDVIGVLNCYDEPREYTEDQVEALAVVAEQAASAVGIARLIEDQRATIGQLDATNRHVVAQHERLQRSEHSHDTLISLLLENRPLDDITATLSELLGTAVILQDEELRVLSRSGTPDDYQGIDRDGTARRELERLTLEPGKGRPTGTLDVEVRPGRSVLVVPLDLGGPGSGYLSAPLEAGTEREFSRERWSRPPPPTRSTRSANGRPRRPRIGSEATCYRISSRAASGTRPGFTRGSSVSASTSTRAPSGSSSCVTARRRITSKSVYSTWQRAFWAPNPGRPGRKGTT